MPSGVAGGRRAAASLLAAVQIGDEQIARGEYRVYTPALFEEIKRNARDKVKRGHQPNPMSSPNYVLMTRFGNY